MSVARRPLLTATAAATLLCALWFVPSAKAAEERSGPVQQPAAPTQSFTSEDPDAAAEPVLADTGSPNTTPYLVGGTTFLGVGAGFVAYSARRAARLV